MKNILYFILFSSINIFGQNEIKKNHFKNIEIFYSPFQTRIGGLEYEINRVNDEGAFDTRTRANTYSVNNYEFGFNYLFKIKKLNFGLGLSHYTDSYKYSVYASITDRLYRINTSGLSLNLFYRKKLLPSTSIDLGLNTRIRTNYKSNSNNYSDAEFISNFNIVYFERRSNLSLFQLIPSIQFNTEIYNGFYIRYGLLAKFWGKDFYSITANKKGGNQDVVLDFNANSSVFKGTISIGYKFNK